MEIARENLSALVESYKGKGQLTPGSETDAWINEDMQI
jgi:hypothetical protein